MEELKTYRLADICNSIQTGPFGSQLHKSDYVEFGTPIVMPKDITNGKINDNNISRISKNDVARLFKHKLVPGNIIYPRRGDISKCALITSKEDGWVCGTGCIKVDINQQIANSTYVMYVLCQSETVNWIESNAVGTTMLNLNTSILSDLPIKLPSLNTQKKLANIVSSFDKKIALNRRINDNLEQQAQALFDYYFSADSKYLSDSERGVLTNIAVYLNGLAMQKFPPTDSEHSLPVLKIKELGQGKCDNNSDRCSNDIDSNYVIDNGNIIFSWSGTLMVDVWCGGKCGLNQHLFKVTPLQDHPQWFIYYWTIRHLNTFKLIAKDKAVTMGHIKRVDLEKAEVIIPNKYSLVEMNAQIEPLYQSIINNRLQIAELETLRDALLPKLMSGELKINNLNC